jgi:hypothetical protein
LATTRNPTPASAKAARGTTAQPARAETDTTDTTDTAAEPASAGRYSVTMTLPVNQVVSAATSVAKAPVTVARRVIPATGGLPVYLGLGGLAVIGAVEWPLAAAAGVGFAALRRWGPLRPTAATEQDPNPPAESTTES